MNLTPIITEQSMKDAEANKFSFKVPSYARKEQIKKAIRNKFAVDVVSVSTTLVKGKRQRVGTRRIEKSVTPWKKAIVKVKAGQKIGLFDASEK
jgi:large subunit ribosomal protein L23